MKAREMAILVTELQWGQTSQWNNVLGQISQWNNFLNRSPSGIMSLGRSPPTLNYHIFFVRQGGSIYEGKYEDKYWCGISFSWIMSLQRKSTHSQLPHFLSSSGSSYERILVAELQDWHISQRNTVLWKKPVDFLLYYYQGRGHEGMSDGLLCCWTSVWTNINVD